MICSSCQMGYHDDCTWGGCACRCWKRTDLDTEKKNFKGGKGKIFFNHQPQISTTSNSVKTSAISQQSVVVF